MIKILRRAAVRAFETLKKKGWRAVLRRGLVLGRKYRDDKKYQKWIRDHAISGEDRARMLREIESLPQRPLISVILPVYNVEERWLRLCLDSVINQIYPFWELCIADDCSPSPHVRRVLDEYAAREQRIKLVFRTENGHISAASNSALELAAGEFAALLDHDDELAEDALYSVAKEISEHPSAAFIYTDEDMIDESGRRYFPKFKPDWSPDLFYSVNYVTHLAVYRTDILRAIGGFRAGMEGSQDYDLALRVVEQTGAGRIRHIPKILYHWRAIRGSVAVSAAEKPYAADRARRAIGEHFQRTGKNAIVEPAVYDLHRVRYALPGDLPSVSLILSAAGDERPVLDAVTHLFEKTDYPIAEIIIVCSDEIRKKLEPRLLPAKVRTLSGRTGSSAEDLNRAAFGAGGEYLCFADADLRPLSPGWLKELLSFAAQADIGAVGPKILAADETVIDAGLVVGFGGTVGAAHRGLPREADGNLFRAQIVNNFSAVSVSCLAVRRETFGRAGGFDAENFSDALFDADFCLRLAEKNLRTVFTPYAELARADKKNALRQKRASAAETEYFRRRWKSVIEKDPCYNPNLSLEGETFSIKV